ncbi:MAG TPA: hypothetical protein VK152_03430 [Paludibacter sp.]|nr:hypothetical protein [Paludibacter sp.]
MEKQLFLHQLFALNIVFEFMKKPFSILFAMLIILSGMHLSLATHLCGGEISAVKFSISDEKASCGMCATGQTVPAGKSFENESCCKDEMSFLAVDTNYSPSTLQINHIANQLLQAFDIPKTIGIQFVHTNSATNTNVQPPGTFIASAVSLPGICVFLI